MRSKSPSFDLRRHSGLGSETKACSDKDLDEAIAIAKGSPPSVPGNALYNELREVALQIKSKPFLMVL
jgi:hypothetical protein